MANKKSGKQQPIKDNSHAPTSSNRAAPTSKKIYTMEELKTIGDSCKNRPPPASAVQAMSLYGLQRQTKAESLVERLASLEKQEANNRRATTSTTGRLKVHGDKLAIRIDAFDEQFADVRAQLNELKIQTFEATAIADAAITAAQQTAEEQAAISEPGPDSAALAIVKQEMDNLFHDRDNILVMVEETKTRLQRLEENVRALTLQRAPAAKPPVTLPHRLPVTTSNGSQMELSVPKGMAHVGLKKEKANLRGVYPNHMYY